MPSKLELQSSSGHAIRSNPTYSSVEPDGAGAADGTRFATAVNPAYDTAAATAASLRPASSLYDYGSVTLLPAGASATTERRVSAITEELPISDGTAMTPSDDIGRDAPLYDMIIEGPLYDAAAVTGTPAVANAPILVDRSTKPKAPTAAPRKPREFVVADGTDEAQC